MRIGLCLGRSALRRLVIVRLAEVKDFLVAGEDGREMSSIGSMIWIPRCVRWYCTLLNDRTTPRVEDGSPVIPRKILGHMTFHRLRPPLMPLRTGRHQNSDRLQRIIVPGRLGPVLTTRPGWINLPEETNLAHLVLTRQVAQSAPRVPNPVPLACGGQGDSACADQAAPTGSEWQGGAVPSL